MDLRHIKKYLSSKLGCKIIIVYFGSRNKREKYYGILNKTYNNVFTVCLSTGEVKSFNYSDILTKTIQIYI